MSIQTKIFKATIQNTDPETGMLEAIVSVFNNIDRVKDIIRPGFFQKSLDHKLPKGVWMHDWKQPVAKTLEARELLPGDPLLPGDLKDLGGLYIKGQFNLDTQRGREAYSDVKFGLVDEFSIGYNTTKEKRDTKTGINEMFEGECYEWSPVLVGANKQTQLLNVKGESNDDDDVGLSPISKSLLAGLTFEENFKQVLDAVEGLTERSKQIKELREKDGKRYSTTNQNRIRQVVNQLNALLDAQSTQEEADPVVVAATTPGNETTPEGTPEGTEKSLTAPISEEIAGQLRMIKLKAEMTLTSLKTNK